MRKAGICWDKTWALQIMKVTLVHCLALSFSESISLTLPLLAAFHHPPPLHTFYNALDQLLHFDPLIGFLEETERELLLLCLGVFFLFSPLYFIKITWYLHCIINRWIKDLWPTDLVGRSMDLSQLTKLLWHSLWVWSPMDRARSGFPLFQTVQCGPRTELLRLLTDNGLYYVPLGVMCGPCSWTWPMLRPDDVADLGLSLIWPRLLGQPNVEARVSIFIVFIDSLYFKIYFY